MKTFSARKSSALARPEHGSEIVDDRSYLLNIITLLGLQVDGSHGSQKLVNLAIRN